MSSLASCGLYVAQTYDASLVLTENDYLLVAEVTMSIFFAFDYFLGLFVSEHRWGCVHPCPPRSL